MIVDFKYLKYENETKSYIVHSETVFNSKDFEKLKETNIVNTIESGHFVHRSTLSKVDLKYSLIEAYYKRLLVNKRIIIKNKIKEKDSTLFVMTNNQLEDIETIKFMIENSQLSSRRFRKVSISDINTIQINHQEFNLFSLPDYIIQDKAFLYIEEDQASITEFPNSKVISAFTLDSPGLIRNFDFVLSFLSIERNPNYSLSVIHADIFKDTISDKKTKFPTHEFKYIERLYRKDQKLADELIKEYSIKTEKSAIEYAFNVEGDYETHVNLLILSEYVTQSPRKIMNMIGSVSVYSEFSRSVVEMLDMNKRYEELNRILAYKNQTSSSETLFNSSVNVKLNIYYSLESEYENMYEVL